MSRIQKSIAIVVLFAAGVFVAVAATTAVLKNNAEYERTASIEAAQFAYSINAEVRRCERIGGSAFTIASDGGWTPISPSLAKVLITSAKKRLAESKISLAEMKHLVPVTVRCERAN